MAEQYDDGIPLRRVVLAALLFAAVIVPAVYHFLRFINNER